MSYFELSRFTCSKLPIGFPKFHFFMSGWQTTKLFTQFWKGDFLKHEKVISLRLYRSVVNFNIIVVKHSIFHYFVNTQIESMILKQKNTICFTTIWLKWKTAFTRMSHLRCITVLTNMHLHSLLTFVGIGRMH